MKSVSELQLELGRRMSTYRKDGTGGTSDSTYHVRPGAALSARALSAAELPVCQCLSANANDLLAMCTHGGSTVRDYSIFVERVQSSQGLSSSRRGKSGAGESIALPVPSFPLLQFIRFQVSNRRCPAPFPFAFPPTLWPLREGTYVFFFSSPSTPYLLRVVAAVAERCSPPYCRDATVAGAVTAGCRP